MPVKRVDELVVSRFYVDIDGMLVAIFKECAGLGGSIAIETYAEGGLNSFEHKLPGRASFDNVTLKSGVASASDLWDWFYKVSTGTIKRRDISIVMLARGGSDGEVMRWNLFGAFPVRWQGPEFNAGDANVAVQTLELAHNGIELKKR